MNQHLTVDQFRSNFPSLGETAHLASCSQGALSERLLGELFEFQQTIRTYGAPWDIWVTKVEETRNRFAKFIGAEANEVAIVPSASAGAYQVASTQAWSDRPVVLTTDMEFPSVAQVWLAQQPRGAEVEFVADHAGVVEVEDYSAQIDERTALVSIPLISYKNGLRLPVKAITESARAQGARVFVDAYQGLGVERVNVKDLDCDYLVSGALKYMLGISGIAFLYVRDSLVDDLPPAMTGWFGQENPFEFDPRHLNPAASASRFESGTPSIPSAYGAVAGLSLLEQLDMSKVQSHISGLTGDLQEQLLAAGEVIRSPKPASLRGPQVAMHDADPIGLGAFLASENIVASPRGEVIRLSFHYYNNEADVSRVVAAIAKYRKIA